MAMQVTRIMLLIGTLSGTAGCTLNDVYHLGKDSLGAGRLTSSVESDRPSRFRLHPSTTISVEAPQGNQPPEWLTYARAGVGHVFPESREPSYRLLLSWPVDASDGPSSTDTTRSTATHNRLLDIKLGGLFNPPSVSEVETLTVQLVDATDRLVHQERLTIKPALWRGDWDSKASMEHAFYQFALELAGR